MTKTDEMPRVKPNELPRKEEEQPQQPDPNAIVEQTKGALWQVVQQSQLPTSILKMMLENMLLQLEMAEIRQKQMQPKEPEEGAK